jgi:hypothetical protein
MVSRSWPLLAETDVNKGVPRPKGGKYTATSPHLGEISCRGDRSLYGSAYWFIVNPYVGYRNV